MAAIEGVKDWETNFAVPAALNDHIRQAASELVAA
jgi:hypothetical protein